MLYGLVLVLGTPGFDAIPGNALRKPGHADQVRERIGEPGLALARLVVALNTDLRLPLARNVDWIQRPFRVSQNWTLYEDGPGNYWTMEVLIDGVLRHRSLDPDYDWLTTEIRSRKLRPMMEAVVQEPKAENAKGLVRYMGTKAARDFPGAARVELRALKGPWPGKKQKIERTYIGDAPDWKLR